MQQGHQNSAPVPIIQHPGGVQPVRLRPHHLLCVLTYAGKGYSQAFTAGFDAVVAQLSHGAPVRVVDGPDDICAPLCHETTAHCLNNSVRLRDQRAAADIAALLQRPVNQGVLLTVDTPLLVTWRTAFAQGSTRTACQGCEWHALCTAVAAEGFAAAHLKAVQTPQASTQQAGDGGQPGAAAG